MNFKDAITACLTIHKRPDKVAATKLAINTAIADLIRYDKFDYDLCQQDYTVPADQAGLVAHHIPRTAFTGVRPRLIESMTTVTDAKPLLKIKPAQITKAGVPSVGVFYARGDGFMVVLRKPAATIKISYYAIAPTLVEDEDEHWTLEQAGTAIVQKALEIFFSSIGEDRDAQKYANLSAIAYERIARDLE